MQRGAVGPKTLSILDRLTEEPDPGRHHPGKSAKKTPESR